MRLSVELVPRSAWWKNVRSKVSKADWEKCKKYSKTKTEGVCFICGGSGLEQGRRYATEAHEIWHYDDDNGVQTLVDIVPICPKCHQVKHLGRSRATMNAWQWAQVIEHFMQVNGIYDERVDKYLMEAFYVWEKRSEQRWELDVSFLQKLGVEPKP